MFLPTHHFYSNIQQIYAVILNYEFPLPAQSLIFLHHLVLHTISEAKQMEQAIISANYAMLNTIITSMNPPSIFLNTITSTIYITTHTTPSPPLCFQTFICKYRYNPLSIHPQQQKQPHEADQTSDIS